MFKIGDKVRLRVEAQLPGGSARIAKHTEGVVMVVGQYGVTSLVTVQIQFLLVDCDSSIVELIPADVPAPVEPPKPTPVPIFKEGEAVAHVSGRWPNLSRNFSANTGAIIKVHDDGKWLEITVWPVFRFLVQTKDVRKVTP